MKKTLIIASFALLASYGVSEASHSPSAAAWAEDSRPSLQAEVLLRQTRGISPVAMPLQQQWAAMPHMPMLTPRTPQTAVLLAMEKLLVLAVRLGLVSVLAAAKVLAQSLVA